MFVNLAWGRGVLLHVLQCPVMEVRLMRPSSNRVEGCVPTCWQLVINALAHISKGLDTISSESRDVALSALGVFFWLCLAMGYY